MTEIAVSTIMATTAAERQMQTDALAAFWSLPQLMESTMNDVMTSASPCSPRMPWNKGKLIGAKPPLRLKHVWAIRSTLHLSGQIRDLALFNLGIDSKLRGCDLVDLRVADIAPLGYSVGRATVRQKKTGRPVKFELTEQTREAVDAYLKATARQPAQFLFAGRKGVEQHLTTRQYARLLDGWDIPRSRAPSVISVWRSTTRSRSPNRLTSEQERQSRRALPRPQSTVWPRKRRSASSH